MSDDPRKIVAAYEDWFRSDAGRVVLEDLVSKYARRDSFHTDPYRTAYHEGQRSVVLRILTMLRKAKIVLPEEFRHAG